MNTQELIKIEDDCFINTFTRQPVVLDHGEGVKVVDIDGNESSPSEPLAVTTNGDAIPFSIRIQ